MAELWKLSATEIARMVEVVEPTCERVTVECLERIEAREPEVNAWMYLDPEKALADARVIDTATSSGLVRGVPIGVKDIIDTKDMPSGRE